MATQSVATDLNHGVRNTRGVTIKTVVIPGVEVLRLGTWNASNGPITVDKALMDSVMAAAHDEEVDLGALKIGHVDKRFDGQPAFGWLRNHRMSGDGKRMLADIVDVPVKLAEVAKIAFKRRSPELRPNVTTAGGKTYPYTMQALSLLGVTPPAIKGLGDLLGLFSDKAQDGGFYVHMAQENPDAITFELATDLSEGVVDTDDVTTDPTKGTPMDEAQIRKLFKLSDDADLTVELTKIAATPPAATLADGDDIVKVSKAVWEDTRKAAEDGAKALQTIHERDVKQAVLTALKDGRITAVDQEKWTQRLTEDYDKAMVYLTELSPGVAMHTVGAPTSREGVDLSELSDDNMDTMLEAWTGGAYRVDRK